jgi:hypothetical protein
VDCRDGVAVDVTREEEEEEEGSNATGATSEKGQVGAANNEGDDDRVPRALCNTGMGQHC